MSIFKKRLVFQTRKKVDIGNWKLWIPHFPKQNPFRLCWMESVFKNTLSIQHNKLLCLRNMHIYATCNATTLFIPVAWLSSVPLPLSSRACLAVATATMKQSTYTNQGSLRLPFPHVLERKEVKNAEAILATQTTGEIFLCNKNGKKNVNC